MRTTENSPRRLLRPQHLVLPLCLLLVAAGCRTAKPHKDPTIPATTNETVLRPVEVIAPPPTNEIATPVPPASAPTSVVLAPTNSIPPLSARTGDEIVVAGQLFHTGTRVVLWNETNGYSAYDLKRHFAADGMTPADAKEAAAPPQELRRRYDQRDGELTRAELAHIRTNGWDLPTLQRCVDQFVIHYDVAGTSRQCFYILQDRRFLSVHFMLDLDGTIYQTLDLQERARHASSANDRSVGIEIANIGAYPTNETATLDRWYEHDTNGQPYVTLPERFGDGGLLTTNFTARPARTDAITNTIHGRTLVQYDFTPEQYAALAHLTAVLCRALPQIQCDAPRDTDGKVLAEKVRDEDLEKFQGLVGHYHLTTNKTDPGPACDGEKVLSEAQRLMSETNSAPSQSP